MGGLLHSALTADGVVQGVLLYSSPVQEMMDRLSSLQTRWWRTSSSRRRAAMVIALIFSPSADLAYRVPDQEHPAHGHGDLSGAGAGIKGSGELRRLSETFITMSEKLQMLDNQLQSVRLQRQPRAETLLATWRRSC